jgi:hypothetical protein
VRAQGNECTRASGCARRRVDRRGRRVERPRRNRSGRAARTVRSHACSHRSHSHSESAICTHRMTRTHTAVRAESGPRTVVCIRGQQQQQRQQSSGTRLVAPPSRCPSVPCRSSPPLDPRTPSRLDRWSLLIVADSSSLGSSLWPPLRPAGCSAPGKCPTARGRETCTSTHGAGGRQ